MTLSGVLALVDGAFEVRGSLKSTVQLELSCFAEPVPRKLLLPTRPVGLQALAAEPGLIPADLELRRSAVGFPSRRAGTGASLPDTKENVQRRRRCQPEDTGDAVRVPVRPNPCRRRTRQKET